MPSAPSRRVRTTRARIAKPAVAERRVRLHLDKRRAQLLELGIELFSKHGYEDISIDGVAESAGISKGLLYPPRQGAGARSQSGHWPLIARRRWARRAQQLALGAPGRGGS